MNFAAPLPNASEGTVCGADPVELKCLCTWYRIKGPQNPFQVQVKILVGQKESTGPKVRRLGFYSWLLTMSSQGSHWNSKLGTSPIRERDDDWVDLFNWVNFEGQMKALSLKGS